MLKKYITDLGVLSTHCKKSQKCTRIFNAKQYILGVWVGHSEISVLAFSAFPYTPFQQVIQPPGCQLTCLQSDSLTRQMCLKDIAIHIYEVFRELSVKDVMHHYHCRWWVFLSCFSCLLNQFSIGVSYFSRVKRSQRVESFLFFLFLFAALITPPIITVPVCNHVELLIENHLTAARMD